MFGLSTILLALACIQIAFADIVGHYRISQYEKGILTSSRVETVVRSLEEFMICIGRVNEYDKKIVHHCVNLHSDKESSKEFRETAAINLPIDDSKISTHLFLILKEKYSNQDDVTIASNDENIHSIALPLIFPNDKKPHIVEITHETKLQISLDCAENHYGPRCEIACESSKLGEGLTCHPQTGEIVCEYGWIGDDCSELIFIDRETASEFIKSRFKREENEDDEDDCSKRTCTKEELRQEFLLRGVDLKEEDWINYENECMVNAGCSKNGTQSCMKVENKGYKCECVEGYEGEACSELDLCYFVACENDATCKVVDGNAICECLEGFDGIFCENEINHCLDQVCGYHGECQSDTSGFRCLCDKGFTGENCEHNIDECTEESCSGNGRCVDEINSFHCICDEEYTGKQCEILADGCHSEPCLNGGECNSFSDGFFECTCPDDYMGPTCAEEKPDPCAEDPCNGRGECYAVLDEDEENFYQKTAFCDCKIGYVGKHCETKVSSCEAVEHPCPINATCVDLENEYICVCPSGFEGEYCDMPCENCEDRNELKCDANPCQNDARCLVINQNATCICGPGFTGDYCETEFNFCANVSCGGHGECVSMRDGYKCYCDSEYTGDNCEEDRNECELEHGLCKNDATCINTMGGFECVCTKGFAGITCDHKIDVCSFNDECLNGGTCIPSEESFMCACRIGYVGLFCEEVVDLCADEPSPCKNNGTCEVVSLEEQEIKCNCHDRYYGRFCEGEIPACKVKFELGDGSHELTDRTDCGSYGECVIDGVKGYACKCHEGYEGEFCDQRISIVTCKDVYCKCESAIPNYKALHDKFDNNTECFHSTYGKGRCGKDECLSSNCSEARPLICQYDADCFDKSKPSPRSSRDANKTIKSCPILYLHFERKELPQASTVNTICEEIRNTGSLSNTNVVVKCTKNLSTSSDLQIAAALDEKANIDHDVQELSETLFQSLKSVIVDRSLSNDMVNISSVFTALRNVSYNNQFIIIESSPSNSSNNDTDNTVDKQPFKKRTKDAVIIAVAVVCSVLLLVLALAFMAFLHKRKSTQRTQSPINSNADNNNLVSDSVHWTKNGKKSEHNSKLLAFDNEVVNGVENNVFTSDETIPSPGTSRVQRRIQEANDVEDITSRNGVSTFVKNSPNGDVMR